MRTKRDDIKLFAECPNCQTQVELDHLDFWASTGDGTMSHPSWGWIALHFDCPGCSRSFEMRVNEW